nr:hypothetical protein [Rhodoplanes sp. Z2-YC6860]
MTDTSTIAVIDDGPSPEVVLLPRIEWGPVIGGAIAAAALVSVLQGFAAAIGLSVSSASPTWRDASFSLILLSGLYLLLTALASYAFGAYVAGRMRMRLGTGATSEIAFRDGMHGILVWALATLLAVIMALSVAAMTQRLAAPAGLSAAPSASVAGENIIAFDLDRLFRGERRPPAADLAQARSEAARILMTSSSHTGMRADDRAYLVRLTSAYTGLSAPDAEKRVTEVAGAAREDINRARRAAAILAFMVAAAALVGAGAAWYAACAAGRHREGIDVVPNWWSWERPFGASY